VKPRSSAGGLIAQQLKAVADRRGVPIAVIASDILRGPALKLWEAEIARMAEAAKRGGKA
jgi:hypothetical protein